MLKDAQIDDRARRYLEIIARPTANQPLLKYYALHPDLFKLDNATQVHPNLYDANGNFKVTEVAEQVYMFSLFTEEFVRKLIEECEHAGIWEFLLQRSAT